jgi:ABC-type polysaccharide/polyol phosphate export permease
LSTPAQVWSYRTLIANLAQRDLKARYKKSFLGWLWSLINPATTLAIYTVVFGLILGAQAPIAGTGRLESFALYLFCGLVAWNFFSGTINICIASFQSAGGLLTRTYFPPECPMVAGLVTVAIQAVLELLILFGFMIVLGNVSWTFVMVVPIFMLLACLSFGVGLVLGLGNIRYRDVSYLVGIGLQVLFYLTPIVYTVELATSKSAVLGRILQANPLTSFVYGIRQSVYSLDLPTTSNWLMMGASATVSLVVGWWIFGRYAPSVIEEL